jgi:hypothetical protein
MDTEKPFEEAQIGAGETATPMLAHGSDGDWLIVLDSSEDDGDTLIRYPAPGSLPSPVRSS